MSDCIFCKLANKEIPTEFLYEDENVVAFNDLNPLSVKQCRLVSLSLLLQINITA